MVADVDLFSKIGSSPPSSDREAAALEAVRGPGIVNIAGRGDAGELLLARAVCSLADVLHERGALPEGEVRAVGAAAASALARVHDAGLVHGDVKPANLLLSPESELWLADFDASTAADGKALPLAGAPRQAPDDRSLPAADIRALALTIVELATGALIDPAVCWRAGDLRLLGCAPALSADVAFMLGADNLFDTHRSTPSACSIAELLERGAEALPAPAVTARGIDPTPTIEFMATPAPKQSDPESNTADDQQPARWWQRLAASWRPDPASGPPPPAQESKDSQVNRSS